MVNKMGGGTEATMDIRRHLSALPMFRELSQTGSTSIIQYCSLLRVASGEMIFTKGEACEQMHVLISGRIKLYVVSTSGQEKIVELVRPGQSFAGAAMFLENLYLLNAKSLTSSLLMCINKDAILGAIARNPQFSMHMLSSFSNRIKGLLRDVEGYALSSAKKRLIDYLLIDLAGEHTNFKGLVSVYLPASKATIASKLSLTPEYFSKVLHELEAAGLIEIDKREIRIVDTQQLALYGGISI